MAYSTATRTETEAAKKKKEQENSLKKAFSPSIKTSGVRDDAEQEADRVSSALRGMRGSADLQTGGENSGEHSARQQRLSPYVAMIGQQLGADFSDVNIHTDEKADELAQSADARAFTTGGDIYFAKGEYAPEQDEGRELLAHELTHTIQQGAAAQQGGAVDVQQSAPAGTLMRAGDSKGRQAAVESAAATFKERFTKLAEPAESIGVKRVRENMTEGEKKKAQEDEAGPEFQAKGKGERFGAWAKDNWADASGLIGGGLGLGSNITDDKTASKWMGAASGTMGALTGAGSGIQDFGENKKKGDTNKAEAAALNGTLDTAAGGIDTAAAFSGDETEEQKENQKIMGASSAGLSGMSAGVNVGVKKSDYNKAAQAKAQNKTEISALEGYLDKQTGKPTVKLTEDINACSRELRDINRQIFGLRDELNEKDADGNDLLKDADERKRKEEQIEELEQKKQEVEDKRAELESYRDDPGILRRFIGKKRGESVENTKNRKSAGVGIVTSLFGLGGAVLNLAGSLGGNAGWAKVLKNVGAGLGMAAAGMGIASRFFVNRNEKNNQQKSVDTMMNFEENKKTLVKNDGAIDMSGKNWEMEFNSAKGGATQIGKDLVGGVEAKDPAKKDTAFGDIREAIEKIKLDKNEIKRIIVRAYGFKSGKRAEAFQKMMGQGGQAQGTPATPQPATPQSATPQPATPQSATPQPATPQSATPQPATP